MRTVNYHCVNGANENINITADDLGAGGASHEYLIQPVNSAGCEYGKLSFQNGPIKEAGYNGLTNEAVLAVVIDRLRCFQSGAFSCRENALALTKLEEAMHWMNHRTKERLERGVEGKNIV